MGQTKTRNVEMDVLRGFAIILVVMGHTYFAWTKYIYLFHMAVFFMASGFFYKSSAADNWKSVGHYLVKKVKGIWLPFVVWNTIYTLLTNVFIRLHIYTDNPAISDVLEPSLATVTNPMGVSDMIKNILKGLLLAGHTELGGAFWFLRILFYISVAYVFVDFIALRIFAGAKKPLYAVHITQAVVAVILLAAGFMMRLTGFDKLGIDIFCSSYCLFYMGCLFGCFKLKERKVYVDAALVALGAVLIYLMSLKWNVSLAANQYNNPLALIVASVVGWGFVLGLAGLAKRVKGLREILVVVGQNSLYIVLFHFLAFKLVNLLITVIKGNPIYAMAGFPVSYKDGGWWIVYTIVGTAIPVGLGILWKKIKLKLRKN